MSASLSELVEAQDTLNAALKSAVETFLATSPEFSFNYCNIQNTSSVGDTRTVSVNSTVEATVDSARITRTSPTGA